MRSASLPQQYAETPTEVVWKSLGNNKDGTSRMPVRVAERARAQRRFAVTSPPSRAPTGFGKIKHSKPYGPGIRPSGGVEVPASAATVVRRKRLLRADLRDRLVPGAGTGDRDDRCVTRFSARYLYGWPLHRQPAAAQEPVRTAASAPGIRV